MTDDLSFTGNQKPYPLVTIEGIGPTRAERLQEAGIEKTDDLATADVEELAALHGFSKSLAEDLIQRARVHHSPSRSQPTAGNETSYPPNPDTQSAHKKTEGTNSSEGVKALAVIVLGIGFLVILGSMAGSPPADSGTADGGAGGGVDEGTGRPADTFDFVEWQNAHYSDLHVKACFGTGGEKEKYTCDPSAGSASWHMTAGDDTESVWYSGSFRKNLECPSGVDRVVVKYHIDYDESGVDEYDDKGDPPEDFSYKDNPPCQNGEPSEWRIEIDDSSIWWVRKN